MTGDQLRPVHIARSSAVEQLADALRERILRGELASGAPLREAAVAAASGVSRNTVREVLLLLTSEGLVQHEPHRGAFVARLTATDIRDLYTVRRVLEFAAIDAAAVDPAPDLTPLRGALDSLAAAAAAGDWLALVEADLQFHARVVDLQHSARLSRSFGAIEAELRLGFAIVAFVDREFVEPQALVDEHRRLLDLIAARRADDAKALLEEHLVGYRERLVEVIAKESSREPAAS